MRSGGLMVLFPNHQKVKAMDKRRKENLNSKDGVYGRMVCDCGGHKKSASTNAPNTGEAANTVVVLSAKDNEKSAKGAGNNPKKKSRGIPCAKGKWYFLTQY